MSLATDPRLNPKLLAIVKAYGMDQNVPVATLTPDSPFDAIRSVAAKADEAQNFFFNSVVIPEATSSVKVTAFDKLIPRSDNTELRLTIRKPASGFTDSNTRLPAVVYIHGGGMTLINTDNPPYKNWAETLVRTGLVVVTVHFRNAYGKDGDNPFPAGLEDCATATRWVDEHRTDLGISKVVLQGESGGGNLCLATALKANKEGWIQAIDGVAAYVPYISGAYGMPTEWQLRELPSLVENDGYTIDVASCALYTKMYDPDGKNAKNPLAFPYWAEEDDLRGLPPHLVITSELDPFRDEGNVYYRKLARAGVKAIGKTVLGAIHGTEFFWGMGAAGYSENSVWEIKKFADST